MTVPGQPGGLLKQESEVVMGISSTCFVQVIVDAAAVIYGTTHSKRNELLFSSCCPKLKFRCFHGSSQFPSDYVL